MVSLYCGVSENSVIMLPGSGQAYSGAGGGAVVVVTAIVAVVVAVVVAVTAATGEAVVTVEGVVDGAGDSSTITVFFRFSEKVETATPPTARRQSSNTEKNT